jgi:hypothetical protein
VERLRLTDIVTAHAGGRTIDFLKVDVEGLEADVLASLDLARIRPRVILVEAVDEDGEPTHMSWEPSLLAGGYRFALFDGLNRFYCRAEEAEAVLPLLAAPAYVLDNFRLAREVRAQAALSDRLDQEVAAHRACDVALQDERRLQAAALARSQAEALRLREAIEALKAAEREARHALEQVHASTSWRVTEPLRNAGRIVRLLRPRRTRA